MTNKKRKKSSAKLAAVCAGVVVATVALFFVNGYYRDRLGEFGREALSQYHKDFPGFKVVLPSQLEFVDGFARIPTSFGSIDYWCWRHDEHPVNNVTCKKYAVHIVQGINALKIGEKP